MHHKNAGKAIVSIVCLTIIVMLFAAGCGGNTPMYKIDPGENGMFFEGIKSGYKAGEEAEIYYTLIASDTDYSFFIDGEPMHFTYEDGKGMVIRFTMPDHDVKLEYEVKNSMEPVMQAESGALLFDYYYASQASADSGGHYEITLTAGNDLNMVYLDEYLKGSDEEDEINKCYLVPYDAVDECMAVVEKYGMYDWNERDDTVSIDGALTVCRFPIGETMIRVSSEAMPADGEKAFDAIRDILTGYMSADTLIIKEQG